MRSRREKPAPPRLFECANLTNRRNAVATRSATSFRNAPRGGAARNVQAIVPATHVPSLGLPSVTTMRLPVIVDEESGLQARPPTIHLATSAGGAAPRIAAASRSGAF